MNRRGSGILLHITSLPSRFGIGDLGPEAYNFVDFLVDAHQSYWQILPLNPTEISGCNSPYQSISAFAANPLIISPELLFDEGLLQQKDFEAIPEFPAGRVTYSEVTRVKLFLLDRAFERFDGEKDLDYERFCHDEANWLDDFALFSALKSRFQGSVWNNWPHELRLRVHTALNAVDHDLRNAVEKNKFIQYTGYKQWLSLKKYCRNRGIQIIGDLPIYVQYDSVDVWRDPHLFKLDENLQPWVVAGVPPDYFSSTGQLWGNPVYRWDALKDENYSWWIRRIRHNLRLFDFVRIDHFRGLVAYWEVASGENTAINGRWIEAPVMDFLRHLQRQFPTLPIIAEDLGIITPDVREVMHTFGFPGMRILMFAFGGDLATHPYIPHNLEKNCLVYTGTHDNNTVRAWLEGEATDIEKNQLAQYLGREVPVETIHWELIRILMMSAANTVIMPVQDILGLGGEARMNRPATVTGNWEWRLRADQIAPAVVEKLRIMTDTYGRE